MSKCKYCGKEYTPNGKHGGFCSYRCLENWTKFCHEPNCKCVICGREIYYKPCRIKNNKTGITCSMECAKKLKSIVMSGENNHQYGLIGDLNSSFKKEEMVSNYGYILEYCPNHPYPHDRSNHTTRVLQHRLVVERNYKLFDPIFFEIIDGHIVLKQEYIVHHKNHNKKDNRIENLAIMTKSEHSKLHNKEMVIKRDSLGRIIGVSKLSNIGESCDANPEINSQITKGCGSSYSVEGE